MDENSKHYGVRIGTKSFVLWCEDWRETTTSPIYPFTKEQALEIMKKKLPKQFVYVSYLVDDTGNEIKYNALRKKEKFSFSSITIGNITFS